MLLIEVSGMSTRAIIRNSHILTVDLISNAMIVICGLSTQMHADVMKKIEEKLHELDDSPSIEVSYRDAVISIEYIEFDDDVVYL